VASHRGRKIHVIVGRISERVILIWPLATYRQFGLTLARTLDSETSEYRGLVVEDGPNRRDWVMQAWEFVAQGCGIDALYLQYLPKLGDLNEICTKLSCPVVDTEQYSFVDCRQYPDWSGFYKALNKKLTSDLRRRQRRLEERGSVEIRSDLLGEDLDHFMSWLLDTKYAALRSNKSDAEWFINSEHREFLLSILDGGKKTWTAHPVALTVDGRYIGGRLDIEYGQTKMLLITTYDPAWAKHGPGVTLCEDSVRRGFEDGFDVIDFRLGPETHKRKWTNRSAIVNDFWVPFSLAGKLYVAWRTSSFRNLLKTWVNFVRDLR